MLGRDGQHRLLHPASLNRKKSWEEWLYIAAHVLELSDDLIGHDSCLPHLLLQVLENVSTTGRSPATMAVELYPQQHDDLNFEELLS